MGRKRLLDIFKGNYDIVSFLILAILVSSSFTNIYYPQDTIIGTKNKSNILLSKDNENNDPVNLSYNHTKGHNNPTHNFDIKTLTLITGHKINIIEKENKTIYQTIGNYEAQILKSDKETYVFPDNLKLNKYDKSLFNIDLLVNLSLTDDNTDFTPVILHFERSYVDENNDKINSVITSLPGYKTQKKLPSINGFSGSVKKDNTDLFFRKLQSIRSVDKVYLDRRVKLNLDNSVKGIGGEDAKEKYGVSGQGVTVAVLDTGIDDSHPDLDEGTVILGKDFTDDNSTEDGFGHGTHVAGIIAGDGDASNGLYKGVAPNSSLINVKVLNNEGWGYESWVINGIEYAVNNSADIISMSLGSGPREDDPLAQASDWAVEQGVVVCVSAGNSGREYLTVKSPGISQRSITVGSMSQQHNSPNSFSSRGPSPFTYKIKPDVLAPGYEVISARASGTSMGDPVNDYYTEARGTSMSAPHISGAVALMLEANPGLTPNRIKNRLISTSKPLSPNLWDVYVQGGGLINVSRAIGTDIIISNATNSLGCYSHNETIHRNITIENIDDVSHTYDTNVSVVNVLNDDQGYAEISPTNFTVNPGGNVTLNLTVHTNTSIGYYSGRITFTDGVEEYTTIFGYSRNYNITIRKEPMQGTSVENDILTIFTHDSGRFLRFEVKNKTVPYLSYESNLTFITWGRDENTGDVINIVKEVTIKSSGEVILYEKDTSPYTLNISELKNDYDHWENQSLEIKTKTSQIQTGLRTSYIYSRTVRLSNSSDHVVSLEFLLSPTEYSTEFKNLVFDTPVLYSLTYNTVGVDGAKTFYVEKDKLAKANITYFKSFPGQNLYMHILTQQEAYTFDFGCGGYLNGRSFQTLYMTPNNITYWPWLFYLFPEYKWIQFKVWEPFNMGERFNSNINRNPLTILLNSWNLNESGLSFDVYFLGDQKPDRFKYGSHTPNTCIVDWNNVTIYNEDNCGDEIKFENDTVVSVGDVFNITLIGNNTNFNLSTTSISRLSTTYTATGSNHPPVITNIHLVDLNTNNTIVKNPTQPIKAYIDIKNQSSELPKVMYAMDTAEEPWENSSGWFEANVQRVNSTRFNVTFYLPRYDGTIDLAISAEDDYGNTMKTTTFDAFRFTSIGPYITDYTVKNATTGDPFTFQAGVEDEEGLQEVGLQYWYGDNLSDSTNVSMSNSEGDNWTHNINISKYSLDPLKYIINAVNDRGISAESEQFTAEIKDNDKPTIQNNCPNSATSGEQYTFNVTVEDNIDVSYVNVSYYTDTGGYINESMTRTSDNFYEKTITLPSSTKSFWYKIAVEDSSNNLENTDKIYVMDKKLPVITDKSKNSATTGDGYSFEADIEDNRGVDSVHINYQTDTTPIKNSTMISAGKSNYYRDIEIPSNASVLKYYICSRDISGNWNKTVEMELPVRDNDPPELKDLRTDQPTTGDIFVLNASVEDNIKVHSSYLSYGTDVSETINVSMEKSKNNLFYKSIEIPSNATELHYHLSTRDDANIWTTTDEISINIKDDDSPVITYLSHVNGTTGDTYTIKSNVTDNINVSKVQSEFWFENDSKSKHNISLDKVNNNMWIYNLTLPSNSTPNLYYYISAKDTSQNWVREEVKQVTVKDNDRPIANAGDNVTVKMGETVIFNGSKSYDNIHITEYKWTLLINGSEIRLNGITPSYSFNNSGNFTCILTVKDSAGNERSDNMTVSVKPLKLGQSNDNEDDYPQQDNDTSYWLIILMIALLLLTSLSVILLLKNKRKPDKEQKDISGSQEAK
ncbi:MAG: S8 family serine peptidase [Thermoplasmata archaeon]